jgi:hypothetical protein
VKHGEFLVGLFVRYGSGSVVVGALKT